ncbi:DNA repair protein RecN [Desulfococcaceae bacterium HSG9]|nr:DNA repair protein RecN [Desulfococcaceae bacterium HSG9]
MLQKLSIRNFAIIDDLTIQFGDGLSILSGETGTGKSIIINAVNLLLGSRATVKLIRTGADSAELEALFHIQPSGKAAELMRNQGFKPDQGLLIRRVIVRSRNKSGRHRIYINGRPATMQLLNTITCNLASISGQHANQLLLREEQHLLILDQFGGQTGLRRQLFKCYHQLAPLVKELQDMIKSKQKLTERIDLLEFQKKEITEAAITPDEETALKQECTLLKNGEKLYIAVHESIETLYSSQGAVIEQLGSVDKHLAQVAKIDPLLASSAANVADTVLQIEELSSDLRTYLQTIRIDEHRLNVVEERLYQIQKLKKKYGATVEDVLARLTTIEEELNRIENYDVEIEALETKINVIADKLSMQAHKLSEKRRKTAQKLSAQVEKELASLKMEKTRFEVALEPLPAKNNSEAYFITNGYQITKTGMDSVAFMIAPNVGEALKPLSAIVSGGELSRVVLALKVILAATEAVNTVIFDEVDAGIGGGVAEVLGLKLAALAKHHQVVCITHLPQIAKFGDSHFRIAKHVSKGRTLTTIKPIHTEERIHEIARMLGGVTITPTTLEHAREMLKGG